MALCAIEVTLVALRAARTRPQPYERFLIDRFADLPGVARMTSKFAMKTIKAAGPLPFRA